MPGFPVPRHLLKFAQVPIHCIGDAIQPSHPPSLSSSAFSLSQHQGFFSNELTVHIKWPKYWSFSFSIILSNEYLGVISFKITFCPRGSQESSPEPQFESINSFTLCLLYVPTLISVCDYWKDHSLEYKDLCCKVMSLLLNTTV